MPEKESGGNAGSGGLPQDATVDLKLGLAAEDEALQRVEDLEKKRSASTVAFFDLVGSTPYRYIHGAEEGLKKAYRHNLLVSHCVAEEWGHVVKWTGDGVVAVFHGTVNDKHHPYRALRAAITALRRLEGYNSHLPVDDNKWKHELHTRVGISSGDVHFITVQSSEIIAAAHDAQPSETSRQKICFWDPMGKNVDLANCLQGLANQDAIVVDETTFFDHKENNNRRAMSSTPNGAVEWHGVDLPGDRNTIYLPHAAIFAHDKDEKNVEYSPARMSSFGESKRIPYNTPIDEGAFFVTRPIPCNIRGRQRPVPVVAVTLRLMAAPVKEEQYDAPLTDAMEKELETAEHAYRMGSEDEAVRRFLAVREAEPRSFHANLRLAQYYRRQDNIEEARTAVRAAKNSAPKHPLLWTLAGTTHFESYLAKVAQEANNEAETLLDKAIIDLKRARQLAKDAFDCFLEQYCACLLGICYYIRAPLTKPGHEKDLEEGRAIRDEIEKWSSFCTTNAVLARMMEVFAFVAVNRRTTAGDLTPAMTALDAAEQRMTDSRQKKRNSNRAAGNQGNERGDRTEALMGERYLRTLVEIGRVRLRGLELRK